MNQQENSDHFGSIPISQEPGQPQTPEGPKIVPPDPKPTFSRKATKAKKKGSFLGRSVVFLLVATVVTVAFYLLGGYFLFPSLIKSYGAQKLASMTGRPVTISQASFNPVSLRLELGNSLMGSVTDNPEDTVDPVISFSRLTLEIDPRSVIYKSLICNEFTLNQLYVYAIKGADGTINLNTIKDQLTPKNRSKRSSIFGAFAEHLKTNYSLNNISIKNSEVIFADVSSNKKHHVNDLHIDLPTLATINYQTPEIKPHFSAIVNGSPVSLTESSTQQQDTSIIQFGLNMEKIDVMSYKNYLPETLNSIVRNGQADLNLQVIYNPKTEKAEDQFKLSGNVNIKDIKLESAQTTTAESVQMEGWLFPLSQTYHLTKLVFNRPQFSLSKSGSKFSLSPPFDDIQTSLFSPQPSKRLSYFEIIQGRLAFINNTAPKAIQQWQDINLTIKSESFNVTDSEKIPSVFSLTAEKSPKTRINLQGIFNPEPYSAKGIFEADELDVATISSLSDWLSGSAISQGSATYFKSNFSYDKNAGKKNFIIDNMQIRARDIELADNGKPLAAITNWQSENGFYYNMDNVLQLGSVQVKNATFYTSRPQADKTWRSILTGPPALNSGQQPTQTSIASLEISDSQITIQGTTPTEQGQTLSNFSLSAPQIKPGSQNLFTASASIGNSPLNTSGSFSLKPFLMNGHIKAEKIPTAFLNTIFVSDKQSFKKGDLRIDGSFAMPNLSFEGAVTLSNLSLANTDYSFSSKLLNSSACTLKSNPVSLSFDQLSLDQPHLNYTKAEKTPSLLWIFTAPQAFPANERPPVQLSSLYVRDGSISYTNKQLKPEFTTVVKRLNGSLTAPENSGNSSFAFRGQLDVDSTIDINGSTTLFSEQKSLQANYQINNYPAAHRSSFLSPFMGYAITKGQMDIVGKLQASQNSLSQSLDFTFTGLELGQEIDKNSIKIKSAAYKDTPLLQALLQEENNKLAISLSFSNNQADQHFNAGEALLKQYEKLLLKVRVSPFAFLDGQTKGGPIPQTVFFQTGASDLSAANKELLSNLASKLTKRPLLKIRVDGYADSFTDRKALIDEKIAEINRRQRKHDAKLSQALSSSYGQEVIAEPFSNDYEISMETREAAKKNIHISDQNLLKLAQKRIEEVLQFFKEKGVADSQVLTGTTQMIDSRQLGREGTRIDLKVSL